MKIALKKIPLCCLLACICGLALLSSCKKDDPSPTPGPGPSKLTYAVNIASELDGVVSPFTYQYNPGELSLLLDGLKLRLRTYIYGSDETLVACDSVKLNGYNESHRASFQLSPGEYTAVAISDVVVSDGNSVDFEFWRLTNPERLTSSTIKTTERLAQQFGILGIANHKFTVSEKNLSATLNLAPAGALFYVEFTGMSSNEDVTYYELSSKNMFDYVTLNNSGTFKPHERTSSNYDWRLTYFDDPQESPNVYDYCFMFPMDNMHLRPKAKTKSDEWFFLCDEIIVSPKAGEEYKYELQIHNRQNQLVWGKVNNSTRAVDMDETEQNANAQSCVQLPFRFEDSQSAKVKNLLK